MIRDSYLLSSAPSVSLKIYHGRFEGLVRVEVEFKSELEAFNFKSPEWFGEEITNNPLGRDGKLIKLNVSEFKELISTVM